MTILHDFDEEERLKRILAMLEKSHKLSIAIDEVVGRLSEKRVTLEEKMIRSYFHQVAANMLEVSACVHRALAKTSLPGLNADSNERSTAGSAAGSAASTAGGAKPESSGETGANRPGATASTAGIVEHLSEVESFLERLQTTVDELLKVLRYDLNFVEQYFEFNFYGRLTNEDGFVHESQRLLENLRRQIN